MNTALAEQLNTISLYQRLGAQPGIRRIVDGMVDAQLQSPVVQARFQPCLDDPDRVEEIKDQTCKFVEPHADGPNPDQGRGAVYPYRRMVINAADYMAAVDDTGAETSITTGDFYEIPPGQHAHVEGSEPVSMILFEPPEAAH